jgi:hypothetical protein
VVFLNIFSETCVLGRIAIAACLFISSIWLKRTLWQPIATILQLIAILNLLGQKYVGEADSVDDCCAISRQRNRQNRLAAPTYSGASLDIP